MIKFVYFDVGGTTIKDFSKHPEMWEDFKKEFPFVTEEYWEEKCSPVLELGETPENLPIPLNEFVYGFVKRFKPNISIWPIIESVKCKKGLLTNMYLGMLEKIKSAGLLPPVEWDVVIDTSIVKIKKPEEKIYMLAQEKAGVKPEEILFIDNVEKNLEVPKRLGWSTFLYDSSDYEQSSKNLLEYFYDLTK